MLNHGWCCTSPLSISFLPTRNPTTKFTEQLLLSAAQIPFELFETSVPLKQTVSARTQAYISLQQRPYWAPSRRGGNLISLLQGRISAAPHMCAHVVYHREGALAGWKSQFGTGEAPCRKPFILLRNETDGSWNGPRLSDGCLKAAWDPTTKCGMETIMHSQIAHDVPE